MPNFIDVMDKLEEMDHFLANELHIMDNKLEKMYTALAIIFDKIDKESVVVQRVSGEFSDMQRDMLKQWKENVDRENEERLR